ncbi:hypothetical protein SAMN05216302_11091 [Nitrosomonas aestuarii]|uniref:Uncharacterized protein n=1 Tax=Nitrosomonas aestuarii TaxID=52441 RepID=A0A1I4HVS3_9PROT|nr:hypothetical protein [Nitrosomonas aestuarii]SFL45940.1 hypothetical protein SAMN05216302_11091 [Nitrosomonas aestuarii]
MDISIKKLEQQPTWTILVICSALIGSGFAVMNWYHEKQIIYITSKYEAEISGCREKLRGAKNERSRDKLQVATNYEQLDYNTASKYAGTGSRPNLASISGSAEVVDASSGVVFKENDPYPIDHNKVKIGAPVSLLKSIYPSGSLNPLYFGVGSLDGPFGGAIFFHNQDGMDPKITKISFFIKDELADQRIRSEAISTFQKYHHESSLMGRTIRWRILDTEITIEDGLMSLFSPSTLRIEKIKN